MESTTSTPEIVSVGKNTEKKAKSEWGRVKSVDGLYRRESTGVVYSRYRLNGKRTFRRLETTVLTVAVLRHKERVVNFERDRQTGATISQERKSSKNSANWQAKK